MPTSTKRILPPNIGSISWKVKVLEARVHAFCERMCDGGRTSNPQPTVRFGFSRRTTGHYSSDRQVYRVMWCHIDKIFQRLKKRLTQRIQLRLQ